MEVQDSAVVRFISGGRDGAGLHTAVFTDPFNCAFPPMTLFTAVDVRVGAVEFDGTEALLKECKRRFGGLAPTPAPDASRGGRLHVGRQQLIEWLGENHEAGDMFKSEDPEEKQNAIDWFHENMLPLGVESTIHTVNQTLVTVQATYLLPAEDEATDLRHREHCLERSKQYVEELTGWVFTVDGKQLECSEADWGLRAAEIQDAKLVLVTPACAESDIENKSEVEGNVAIIARGSCTFVEKVERAVAAGAIAVIVTNNDEENPDEADFLPMAGDLEDEDNDADDDDDDDDEDEDEDDDDDDDDDEDEDDDEDNGPACHIPEGGFQVPVLGVSFATGAVLSTATSVSRALLRGAPAVLAAFGTAATAKLLQEQYGATGLPQGWEWFLENKDTAARPAVAAAVGAGGGGAAAAAAAGGGGGPGEAGGAVSAKLMGDSEKLG
jgi:hypothetical protein